MNALARKSLSSPANRKSEVNFLITDPGVPPIGPNYLIRYSFSIRTPVLALASTQINRQSLLLIRPKRILLFARVLDTVSVEPYATTR